MTSEQQVKSNEQDAKARHSGDQEGMPPAQMPRIGASVWLSGPQTKRRRATLAAPPYLQFAWQSRSQLVRMRY
eukprot:5510131-Pleurochrysis_carterae.AAC.1